MIRWPILRLSHVDSPTLRISQFSFNIDRLRREAFLQAHHLTMTGVRPTVHMRVNEASLGIRSVHLHPHIRAVHDMIFPSNICHSLSLGNHLWSHSLVDRWAGVVNPRSTGVCQKGIHDLGVETLFGLPAEREKIEGAVSFSCFRRTVPAVGVLRLRKFIGAGELCRRDGKE